MLYEQYTFVQMHKCTHHQNGIFKSMTVQVQLWDIYLNVQACIKPLDFMFIVFLYPFLMAVFSEAPKSSFQVSLYA